MGRPFMNRMRRGGCPTCGKRGLGKVRVTHSGRQARDCCYCGDMILLNDHQRDLAEEQNAFTGQPRKLPSPDTPGLAALSEKETNHG